MFRTHVPVNGRRPGRIVLALVAGVLAAAPAWSQTTPAAPAGGAQPGQQPAGAAQPAQPAAQAAAAPRVFASDAGMVLNFIAPDKVALLDAAILKYAKRDFKEFSLKGYEKKAKKLLAEHKTFEAVAASQDLDDVLTAAPSFPRSAFSAKALKAFLIANRSVLKKKNSIQQSQYIKLVCIYDWIENRT